MKRCFTFLHAAGNNYKKIRYILWLFVFLAAFSCATVDNAPYLLRTDPSEHPLWVHDPPEYEDALSVVGVSQRRFSISDAREEAWEAVVRQTAQRYGVSLSVIQTQINQVDAPLKYFTEIYVQNGRETYIVYILCVIDKMRLERELAILKATSPQPTAEPLAAAVRIDFIGDAANELSAADKENARHRVRAGIAKGIADAKAPVRLVSTASNVFVVTINLKTFPKTAYTKSPLYGCSYDIRFERENLIEQSELHTEPSAFSPEQFLGDPLTKWLNANYPFFMRIK